MSEPGWEAASTDGPAGSLAYVPEIVHTSLRHSQAQVSGMLECFQLIIKLQA